MRIAVAGGTGVVGRYAVEAARDAGHDVVVLSRSAGADVITGAGLADALQGVDAVVDVTNTTTLSAAKAVGFFETATRNLLAAEHTAGVGHHVALSIVGIDGIDSSYYAGKLAQERAVAAGSVPFTIARAAQFHEFAGQLLSGMSGPVAVMPKLLMRPVAAREVGAHLVRVASGAAVGRARDLVGPRDEVLVDVARRQLAFDGVRRLVLGVRLPGAYGKGLASGSLRGGADALQGEVTFDEWLGSEDHAREERA
nr:NAD-dependent epimerase/dehydratase family protein [Microbacterium hydrocarbonoxydans]